LLLGAKLELLRFANVFKISDGEAASLFPNKEKWGYFKNAPPEWSGFKGFFKTIEEANQFLEKLTALTKK